MIVSLAGGTGSVKLLRGLSKLLKPEELKIVGNVGDNFWFYGLYICPDLDTVMYGLSENLDLNRGWGIKDDTFNFMRQLSSLGYEDWFLIGDRDLTTHVIRTYLLKKGNKLDKVTRILCENYGVKQELLPCTNDPLETWILTDLGEMHLQEFWVKRKAKDKVLGVKYKGSEKAEVLKEALDYIFKAKAIVICPANPISSISPILSLKSLRESLKGKRVIAVSPIIGDKPISGPAGKMMEGLNLKVSPFEVAKLYSDFLKIFIVDKKDKDYISKIKDLGIETLSEDIVMRNREDEERLASFILSLFR